MGKKRKVKVSAVLSVCFFVPAVLLAVTFFVPVETFRDLPVISLIPAFTDIVRSHVGIMLFGEVGSIVAVVVLLVSWGIFVLATRRAYHFWWMLPFSAIMYYTVYLFSHLRMGVYLPQAVLGRLSADPSMGQLLIVLLFLLELTLFVLFSYFSANRYRRYRKKMHFAEAKAEHDQRQHEMTEQKEAPPSKHQLRKLQKAEEAERKKRARVEKAGKRAAKPDRRTGREKKQEIVEETLVTFPQGENGGIPDEPALTHPVKALDPDSPLVFPEIKELPRFKTIGSHHEELFEDIGGVELSHEPLLEDPFAKDDIDTVGNKVFVGNVRILQDDSVVLTETPMKDDDDALDSEEVVPKHSYDSLANLRKRMAEDAVAATMVVPTAFTPHPVVSEGSSPVGNGVLHVAGDGAMDVIGSDQKKMRETKDPVAPPDEDMDQISGVGGLVSSNEGKSALLSRSKTLYQFPPEELLESYPDHVTDIDEDTRAAGEDLILTLKQFKIEATLLNIVKGPTVTMYEVSPAPGVRVSSIVSLSDNIALQLAARQIRIVAPIPGKQAVGIEVPNKNRSIIGFRELISSMDMKNHNVPMVLGRKITGEPVVIELTQTPHLLIAGATGSGKSVCVNSLICSILYRRSPKDVRLILVDPKIVELRVYNGIPHLLTPVITEAKKTIKALEFCLYEMTRRYKLLNALAVRNLTAYNKKIRDLKLVREKLPYIVVVIDEFADLMTTVGKELETLLARLAAMARAVGIHLVLATQRPSANVITGIIKSNIPTRIAFMVASQIDSRIIIDEPGAEKLLGKGDMLFAPGWDPNTVRIQGAFLSDEEVERVVEYAKSQGEPDYLDDAFFEEEELPDDDSGDEEGFGGDGDEELMEKALKIVVERQSASASYLQRRLRIGYNRAARLVEQMEDDGYVGPARGSKPRELLKFPD